MADQESKDRLEGKQEENRRRRGPARAEHDPEWNSKDHLDLERSSKAPRRDGAAKDAEGQAERGTIDQTITDDGLTQDR